MAATTPQVVAGNDGGGGMMAGKTGWYRFSGGNGREIPGRETMRGMGKTWRDRSARRRPDTVPLPHPALTGRGKR